MDSSANTQADNRPRIHIINSTINEDGSKEVNYICNAKALELFAEELEKEVSELTNEEIHHMVSKNIGSALKCHDGWRKKDISVE